MTTQRPSVYDLADLHSYVVPVTPKSLKETLCVAEFAMRELERQKPGYNAGGTIESHLERIRLLIDECGCRDNPMEAGRRG